jgi:hypothetical protein
MRAPPHDSPLRRFTGRRQALVTRRARGHNPPAGTRLGRSNEILEALLHGQKLAQSHVIGLVDTAFSHGTPWNQSQVVRDLAAWLRRPHPFEPRQPRLHAFAGVCRHTHIARLRHDVRECVGNCLDANCREVRE